jgi:hypothetical protein
VPLCQPLLRQVAAGDAVVIELDEMRHFLQPKTNKVWIWKAYDRRVSRHNDRFYVSAQQVGGGEAEWKIVLFARAAAACGW